MTVAEQLTVEQATDLQERIEDVTGHEWLILSGLDARVHEVPDPHIADLEDVATIFGSRQQ